MDLDALTPVILAVSALLLVVVVAVRVSTGTGMPSMLIYLGIGTLLGQTIAYDFHDLNLTAVLGYVALVFILTEGGLSTRWTTMRRAVGPAAVLSTLGVGVSIVVTGVFVHSVSDIDWAASFLIGAVVSSTDAAAVFSVLRGVGLPKRVVAILEAESGFNDAPVVIAVIALTDYMTGDSHVPLWGHALMMAAELIGGALAGYVIGRLAASRLRVVALPSSGLYPVAVMAFCALAYGVGDFLHTSGFLATYVCALTIGNSNLPHAQTVRGFAESMGWLAQIGLFILLGLVVQPLKIPSQVLPALVVGSALLLLARPLSVAASLSWFKVPWREQAFLSWAGLRGAVPIMLATIPMVAGVPGTNRLYEFVFVLVVMFTLLQGPPIARIAGLLGMRGEGTAELQIESRPLGALRAAILEVTVSKGSKLAGVTIGELRLPKGANVTLIVRDQATQVPEPGTRLRNGDQFLVVVVDDVRNATEARLHAVGEQGRLARWKVHGPASGQPGGASRTNPD